MEFWFPGKIAVKGVKNGQKDVSIESVFTVQICFVDCKLVFF